MALQFYLTPNHMTSDGEDYMAVSISPESYTIEDVYNNMTREGSTITKAEALASFEEVTQSIIGLVEQGHSVVTPLVNIRPGISGVFDGEDDSFDSERHQININVTAGLRLRKSAEEIDTEKVYRPVSASPACRIISIIRLKSRIRRLPPVAVPAFRDPCLNSMKRMTARAYSLSIPIMRSYLFKTMTGRVVL